MSTNLANLALPGHDRRPSSSRCASSRQPGARAARQPDRRGRDARRDRRHLRSRRASTSYWAIVVGMADRRRASGRSRRARVKMTAMPQMVALFNGVGGGAAALDRARGVPQHRCPSPATPNVDISLAIVLSALIGAISFAGSMIAFAKLQELIGGRPITYPGQQVVNAALLRRARVALGRRARRRRPRSEWLLWALVVGALAVRRAVRAADRRRRHAGRDLAAERLHRARGRGDRLRAREQRPDRERHARRRLGHAADDDDGHAR